MTLLKPFPLQNPSITFGHLYFYRLLDDVFSAGVVNATDFAVAQRGAGANMSVDVAAGEAIVDFTTPEGGKRLVPMDALSNSGTPGAPNTPDWLTTFTAADGTNPRIDRVVLTVRDTDLDSSGARDAALRVIPGTATAGANLTNLTNAAAVPANSLLLANVLVGAGVTSITTANIDTAVRARASVGGGLAPSAGAWTAYTPTWTGTGTNPALGNGTLTGRYVQIGKTVIGYVRLVMGSTTTFGSAGWILSVPVAAALSNQLRFSAFFLDATAGEFKGLARVNSTTSVTLFSGGEAAVAQLVTSTNPFTWATNDEVLINFTYEGA